MPWKVNGEGILELVNGNPVWVSETGEEKTVDYPAISRRLAEVNRESADRKEKLRALETKYEPLKDIEDFSAWLEETNKAREMQANASKDKLALEEQIRARVEAATRPINDKLTSALKDAEILRASLRAEKVANAFSRSEYVQKNLVDPTLAADLFASKFSLEENGVLVAMDEFGRPLFGADGVASFDEAILQLVNASPYKAVLLKGSGATGSGGSSYHSASQNPVKNPWKTESWNESEQHRIYKESPMQARAFMKDAGYYMPGL